MLQNDFFYFSFPETAGDVIKTTLTLNTHHKIFAGHFPNQPIVPGVCMVQMVKEIIENITGKKTALSKADNIKFLSVIDPRRDNEVQMTLKLSAAVDNKIIVDAQLLNDTTTFFKFKGTFITSH